MPVGILKIVILTANKQESTGFEVFMGYEATM